MIRINLNDLATPTLNDVHAKIGAGKRAGLMARLGLTVEREYRAWFTARNQKPNAKGWRKANFWARIRRATAYLPNETTDDQARVSISDPAIRLKIHGGTVRPREARMLALPLNEEAYVDGSPRNSRVSDLGLISLRAKSGTDGANLYLGRHELGKGLVLYYRLVAKAEVPADREALPPRSDVSAALQRRLQAYLSRA